ncbi:ArsC/Spx/MgsR family protein [Salinicola aestuarinus]|uniref:ArsC/Spx/MgsR family protein n=1 Tax=Salinicola aestuarinus TaxID=1949082 RepID=UPI000DA18DE5|nr:ArsC/Spx/MgsR family protein [Salinicola aestuarinus]
MPELTLYHNPRCSKSREALALLESRGITVKIRRYLETPPTRDELAGLAVRLGDAYEQMLRHSDLRSREPAPTTREELVDLLATDPKLLQRPIADDGEYAVIGRPPQAILQLI